MSTNECRSVHAEASSPSALPSWPRWLPSCMRPASGRGPTARRRRRRSPRVAASLIRRPPISRSGGGRNGRSDAGSSSADRGRRYLFTRADVTGTRGCAAADGATGPRAAVSPMRLQPRRPPWTTSGVADRYLPPGVADVTGFAVPSQGIVPTVPGVLAGAVPTVGDLGWSGAPPAAPRSTFSVTRCDSASSRLPPWLWLGLELQPWRQSRRQLVDVAVVALVGAQRPDVGLRRVGFESAVFGGDFAECPIDVLGHRIGGAADVQLRPVLQPLP